MNTGGPAFPIHGNGMFGEPVTLKQGMTLLDWFAGQETIGDEEFVWGICEHYAGPRPSGDWKTNPVEWHEWESRWRAGVKYGRASAMLAERARRETQPTERISIGLNEKRKAFDAFKLLENIDHPEFSAVRLAIAKLTSRFEVGNGEDVQESQTTDDSGKVAKLEALNRELAGELEKFTKAVELFIGDSPELRSARAILAKTKEVA